MGSDAATASERASLSEIANAPAGYDPGYLDREHAILRTSQDLLEQHVKTSQAEEATAKAGQAKAEAQKVTQEAANLPTPQEAAAQRAATLASTQATTGKARVETAKAAEELSQLKRQAASISQPDPTGFQTRQTSCRKGEAQSSIQPRLRYSPGPSCTPILAWQGIQTSSGQR